MRCTLLVTTYNWKEALAAVLASVRRQSRLPDEVVVADDGSRADTRAMLEAQACDFPVVLRHVVGLTPGEIAQRLRRSENSVHGLHHRGRRSLQSHLRQLESAPVTVRGRAAA